MGPQPDLVALGSSAELGRIQERVGRTGGPARVTALGPTGYSPLVLAVPAKLADAMREAGARRTGSTWPELLAALDEAAPDLPLLRPDPASSETGLLHTVGLYRAGHDGPWSGSADDDDAEHAERQVDDRHPLQRDADTLLCEQYTGDAGLPPPGEAAALVSEKAVADHNLGRRPHSSCDNNKPLDDSDRLLAYYPAGVPALDLPLAEVRWDGAPDAPDRTRRTAAVSRFHAWLTHGGSRHLLDGLVRGVDPGQRPAPPQGQAWADPDSGVLEDVEVVARPPGGPEADAAAAAYAETLRPGQVLFLVDNSGSLATGGKLGTVGRALSRALKTLGPEDRYGLWSYPGSADGPETPRVVVAPGTRGDDQAAARTWLAALSPDRVVPRGAAVYEVLDRAVAAMKGEDHPLIVLVTDGDDRPRGDPDRDDHLAWEQTRDEEGTPPVLVLSVRDAGCSEAVIQRLAFGGEDFCVSGRPEEAARQLAERISDHVQGGGTR
ncbi:VWA domain-containing protein [Streptomyces pactum]|uniref:VWA domain-containing protein n=1 Tax=Streptomyces pactum TaxID=68249 RepID=A0ABS0NJJ6_9ACTN|nr:VWA domain-containing protein [Streptomyces pactum]MBH5335282.1 VWA domain-containing protein [Streptomyces pactum]